MKTGWKNSPPAHLNLRSQSSCSLLLSHQDTMTMQLRVFVFTMIPWILISAAEGESLEARKPQKDLNLPDYTFLQDSDPEAVGPKAEDLPTCLLCVCLTGSVYCEEVNPEMSSVPTLPRETAYLYARFNQIKRISNRDFADMDTLKVIDLSVNLISEIDDGAFSKLVNLEELILTNNRLTKLPILPVNLMSFNANFNRLRTQGVKATVFKKMVRLAYLYMGNNQLTAVPQLPESLHVVHLHNNQISAVTDSTFCKGNSSYYIRPNLEQVRLDGNPIRLSQHPNSFICLQSLPLGWN